MRFLSFLSILSIVLGLAVSALGLYFSTASYGIPNVLAPLRQPVLIGEVESVDEANGFLYLKIAQSGSNGSFLRHRISFEPETTVLNTRFDVRGGVIEGYRHEAVTTAALSLPAFRPGIIVRIVGERDEEGLYRAESIQIGNYVRTEPSAVSDL